MSTQVISSRVPHAASAQSVSKTPNAETRAAMAEYEAGEYKTYDTLADMLADMNAED